MRDPGYAISHRVPERLQRRRDFEAVMRQGSRSRGPVLHLAARSNDLAVSRVGYAVSRRVGSAVTRNLIKRRLRSIVSSLAITPGFDIVAVPQAASARASFGELKRATERSASSLGLLSNQRQAEGERP